MAPPPSNLKITRRRASSRRTLEAGAGEKGWFTRAIETNHVRLTPVAARWFRWVASFRPGAVPVTAVVGPIRLDHGPSSGSGTPE
jgi:hypothetical protein